MSIEKATKKKQTESNFNIYDLDLSLVPVHDVLPTTKKHLTPEEHTKIINASSNGLSLTEISILMNRTPATIYRVINRFKNEGSNARRKGSGRNRKILELVPDADIFQKIAESEEVNDNLAQDLPQSQSNSSKYKKKTKKSNKIDV